MSDNKNKKMQILLHSLGLDEDGKKQVYRNRFVAERSSSDWDVCNSLVEEGLMTLRNSQPSKGMDSFCVTDKGITAVLDYQKSINPDEIPLIYRETGRGFDVAEFKDYNDITCSLQASSLAIYEDPGTSAVWLGCDDLNPMVMWEDAEKLGIKTNATSGWIPYPIPSCVSVSSRMHLTRERVEWLVRALNGWLKTGKINQKVVENPGWSRLREHSEYTFSDWMSEAGCGDTQLGYNEWVEHNIEFQQDELRECL